MDNQEMRQKLYDKCLDTVLRRDRARKDAELAQVAYIREFGDLMLETFQVRTEFTKLQRTVSYCQQMKSMGREIDGRQMDFVIGKHMEESDKDRREILAEYEKIQNSEPTDPEVTRQVEDLYRQITEMIHPDLHPELENQPEAQDLWGRVLEAYTQDRLEELQSLKKEAEQFVRDSKIVPREIPTQVMGMMARQMEGEIQQITSADPYQFLELLADAETVAAQKRNLKAEIDRYRSYSEQMEKTISEFDIRR